jgi:dolichol-phosphate mannosyltransferase
MGYSVEAYFAGRTIRGWASLTAIMLFFIAAQFLFLGLIGEYVGRLYLEAKNRPLFVVQTIVGAQRARRGDKSMAQSAS